MSNIERCRRMAGCMAYVGQQKHRRPLFDRLIEKAAPAVVVWGVLAFCMTLIASRHWIF